jgi:hypothetical protein
MMSCPRSAELTSRQVLGSSRGCRGLMVMASGWQSFDRQFEPYLLAIMAAPLRCGLGCRSRTDGRIHRSWFFWIQQSVATKRPPMHKEGIIPVSQQGTLNHTLRVFTLDEDALPSCCWDKACVSRGDTVRLRLNRAGVRDRLVVSSLALRHQVWARRLTA